MYCNDIVSDAVSIFREMRHTAGPPFILWKTPDNEVQLGAGVLYSTAPRMTTEWRDWLSTLRNDVPAAEHHSGVPLFYILAFDPETDCDAVWKGLPRAQAILPAVWRSFRSEHMPTISRLSDGNTCSWMSGPEFDDRRYGGIEYRSVLDKGLELLRTSSLNKIVLARRATLSTDIAFDTLVERLIDCRHSFSLLFSPDAHRVFFSATPERLASVRDGVVTTAAIAGTALRIADDDSDLDSRQSLLSSDKELDEHEYVLDMICDVLQMFCTGVRTGATSMLSLEHLHHLVTPVLGTLHDGRGITDVVASLHPTPAVAGTPRDEAMRAIRHIEGFDRGLFAGVFGWTDRNGNGDSAVTIRSALLHEGKLVAYAGAGIVRESKAEIEALETFAKLRTVIDIAQAR